MKINLQRVIQDIETLATFNATPGTGVTRLSFTKEDRRTRDYLKREMNKIGLQVWEDGYSTLFGRKEGQNPNAPIVMIGSHYDSVINGGAFDGVAGLVAALEILRVFKENKIENYFPIELAAMNDEEGVRFGTGMSNSRAMAGLIKEEELDKVKDQDGITLRKAMESFGVTPDLKNAKRAEGSIKAFVELHIEQGPILEETKKEVGLVENIVGLDRYEVIFKGESGHAGTTPMNKRKDALLAASEFILAVNRIVKEMGDGTVVTVGELSLAPNASNVIPSFVRLSVDLRSIAEKSLKDASGEFIKKLETIRERTGVDVELINNLRTSPVQMSEANLALMEEICRKLGYSYLKMNSGAGHDAMNMAKVAPASLIFVPSKNGLSHHPEECTSYEDLAKGINLMLYTVMELSKQ